MFAAGQRRRDAALQPGQHARNLPTTAVTAPAGFSWQGWDGRRARTVAAGAVVTPRPRPKLPRLAHLTTDTNTHLGRQRPPAGDCKKLTDPPAASKCARTGDLRGQYGQYLPNQ